jgi:hypothetical protein
MEYHEYKKVTPEPIVEKETPKKGGRSVCA